MYTTKSNNKNCNYIVNQTVSWKMMSIDQCEEVFLTAAELLERTGICIDSKAAVELFAANGFWTEGSTVRFPSTKIEWALKAAPSRITICNRYGKRAMRLETQNVHFGPAGGAEKVVDRKTGEPRKMTISDVEEAARLSEVLGNVDFASAPGTPDADGVSVLHSLEALLKYTTKPIMQPVVCGKHAEAAIAMAAAAVGGAAKLRMNPYLVLSVESAEPRYISAETADVITAAAKNGVPIIFSNKLVSGDTAPATTAGTLVVALANTIAAIALAQTVSEGTPVIAGGFFTAIDTENNIAPYGSPEAALISAGFSNLMNYLKIPTAAVAGISNSAASDAQVGVEMTIGTLTTALAGTNMLSAGGLIENGRQFSFGVYAMTDETMGVIYRIMRSFEVDEDRLARGVYDVVGPGGAYLGEEHTSVFFKSEQFWPNLFCRKRIDDWMANGGKTLGQRSYDYVDSILSQPAVSTLDESAAAAIKDIVDKADTESK